MNIVELAEHERLEMIAGYAAGLLMYLYGTPYHRAWEQAYED